MSKAQKKTVKYRWGKRKAKAQLTKAKPQKQEVTTSDFQLRKALLKGYEKMIEDRFNAGYDIYLFTFLFNSLPGKERTQIEQMKTEISNFYSRLVTRVARRPDTPAGKRLLPMIVLYPDKAVYKSVKRKVSLREATTNDGLHFHGIAAADRRGKIKNFLDDYFDEFQADYTTRKLRRVHVERVTHAPAYVTDYALKSFKRPWFEHDDLILLN